MKARGSGGSSTIHSLIGSWLVGVVVAAAVPACSSTRPCRQDSVLLTVNLGALAPLTQALDVDLTLDGVARAPLVWTATRKAFARSESLEIDVPQYQAVRTIAVTVIARGGADRGEIAHGFLPSLAIPPGCLSASVTLMASQVDGGAGDGVATGGAGGQPGGGGEAGGGPGGQPGGGGVGGGGSAGTAGAGAGAVGSGNRGGMIGSAGGGGTGNGGQGGLAGAAGNGGRAGNAGGAGVTGSGGTGAGGGDPCVASGSGAVALLGCPCSVPGTLACNGNAQAVTLICSMGTWMHNETCMAGNLCDSRAGVSKGTCQPIAPPCQGAMPGQIVCGAASSIGQCGSDLVSVTAVRDCTGVTPACLNGACVACKPTSKQACGLCNDGTSTCDGAGAWGTCVSASAKNTYYRDADSDGFGNPQLSMTVCGAAPTGYVANSKDCCDADANAHPGQSGFFTVADACGSNQVPDGFDYDCDGTDTRESSVLNASCVSTLMSSAGCPCPMCYCNSTNGAAPVCGLTSCLQLSDSACGTARTSSATGFDSMCTPGGGGSLAGKQGCR